MKKFAVGCFALVGGAIVLLFVVGLIAEAVGHGSNTIATGGSQPASTPQTVNVQSPATPRSQLAPAVNGVYMDGSTSMHVIVTRPTTDKQGDEYDKPNAGDMFFLVYVTLENQSGSANGYNPLDFNAVDQAGQSFDSTSFLPNSYAPQLPCCNMAAHDRRAGWVGFQIPTSTNVIRLTWSDHDNIDPAVDIARYRVQG